MDGLSFTGLTVVLAVAVAVPLALGVARRAPLSAAALELAVGAAIGPQGLGWVEVDAPIAVLATIGLAFLLFLAGIEVDLAHLRGATVRLAALAFALSVALAVALALSAQAAGLVEGGLFVAVILCGTHLGAVVGTLADAGARGREVARLTLSGAALANVATVALLVLVTGERVGGAGSRAVLLVAFAAIGALLVVGLCGLERWTRLDRVVERLQDTSAQIRVRAAMLLLVGLLAIGGSLGVEIVLAAFAAGAVVSLVDRDAARTHPRLRVKLEGIGYGVAIPVFMVAAGMRLDLDALTADLSSLLLAPLLLLALLVVRGLPALVVYRSALGGREALAAGLLQATSFPVIVVGAQIAVDIEAIQAGTGAALVAAGIVSVATLPAAAKALLARAPAEDRMTAMHTR